MNEEFNKEKKKRELDEIKAIEEAIDRAFAEEFGMDLDGDSAPKKPSKPARKKAEPSFEVGEIGESVSKKPAESEPEKPSLPDDQYNASSIKFEQTEEEKTPKSRKSAKSKKQKELTEAQKKKQEKATRRRRKIAKALLTVFLIGIISVSVTVGGIAIYLLNFIDNTIDVDLDDLVLNYTTTVYIEDGKGGWVEYQRIHGEENRIWVGLSKIPDTLVDAFISIEDERFEEHRGVDWKRTVAALGNEFFHYYDNRQGGSTITQQLVKNLTDDRDQKAVRKIREILRALELERVYSKDTIMECYLNTIPLGGSCYGVEVASEYYFGKEVGDLTLMECAIIAGITKAPNRYRPDTESGYAENRERAETVLAKMLELGKITKEEHDAALAQEIVVVADKSAIKEAEINSYFVDSLIVQVAEDLVEQYNYDYSYALQKVYNGGYNIYATMDPEIQATIEGYAKNKNFFYVYAQDGETLPQCAITVVDYSGNVLGIVGGAGEKDGNMLLDRAYKSAQAPGSAMKSLGAYAPALEQNLITYSSVLEDSPVTVLDGRDWPVNWYQDYCGNKTAFNALALSINTIPCKLVAQMGIGKIYKFVTEKMGLKHLNPGVNADESISALAIGGTNGGITPLEMASAYAVFGNGGKYYEPKLYTRVTDHDGTTDILTVDKKDYIQSISEDTAGIMNLMLQDVVTHVDGTAKMLKGYASNGMKVFAKTGTSNDYFDNWMVAGTPYFVASIWYGFDTPEECETAAAKNMMAAILKDTHKGKAYREMNISSDIVTAEYCKNTGNIAAAGCEIGGIGYYKKTYMPICNGVHIEPELPEGENTSSDFTSSDVSSGTDQDINQGDLDDTSSVSTQSNQ